MEWGVQNGPITKYGVLPVTVLFFGKFCSSLRTWFDVPTIYISIFILFVSAGVLFGGGVSL